ncbi:lipase [Gloeopeniophorella convolvens]|nr:lipase [Gloeopeniophorella convolvens]
MYHIFLSLARLGFALLVIARGSLADTGQAALAQGGQAITTLSPAQVAAFKPFTYFASAAYCSPSTTLTWTCGSDCSANPGFHPVASGGDGGGTQYWYVGYAPAQDSIVVAHQGTDRHKILAEVTDARVVLHPPDAALFPGLPPSVKVHSGFAREQEKTAPLVLAAVQRALAAHPGAAVAVVGHSLGAALALLDAIFLRLQLPSSVAVRAVCYSMPRVGNQAFADYVDQTPRLDVARPTSRRDPVPTVPGRGLGYHHPAGEVHVQPADGAWDACPGQDNPSALCIVGCVPDIFEGDIDDHDGPFDGVMMGAAC